MAEHISPLQAPVDRQSRPPLWDDLAKRVFDLVVSLLSLILLLPLFGLLALAIKRDSPGPVFYRGQRAGRGGDNFYILKFRTMFESPITYQGPVVTAQNDPRITPFGRWLRDNKLNELPQLWNVLRGEMSLVGPRPEDPQIAATWSAETRQEILAVLPGITSPASILYRNEEALLNTGQVMNTYLKSILPSKLRLDQLYVRHHSFWLDLDVLFWTCLVLMPRLGAYQPAEARLFLGPVTRLMRRYLSWFAIDTVVSLVAFTIASAFWHSFTALDVGWSTTVVFALTFVLLFSLLGVLLGVNRIAWSKAAATDVFDLALPLALATVALLGLNHLWPLLPAGLILLGAALTGGGAIAARYRTRLITGFVLRLHHFSNSARIAQERVLIVGGGDAGQFTAWLLHNSQATRALQIVGFTDDDLYKQGARIQGVSVLGGSQDIPQLAQRHDVGLIIFAIHNIQPEERQRVLDICHQTRAQVALLPDIAGALQAMMTLNSREAQLSRQMREASEATAYTSPVLPTHEVDTWLAELEQMVQTGNVLEVQAHIQSLRKVMKSYMMVDPDKNRESRRRNQVGANMAG